MDSDRLHKEPLRRARRSMVKKQEAHIADQKPANEKVRGREEGMCMGERSMSGENAN